jgi:transcriptional regulator with XRE-family HTH domain
MPRSQRTPELQKIGARLRDIRERRTETQRKIAERAGISESHYKGIEGGHWPARRRTYLAIARALDISVEDMDEITGQGE